MGWVIFLAIVAAIVVLIVLGVKKKKRKRAEAIEELKNSGVYALVLKIHDELEKNGYKWVTKPYLKYGKWGACGRGYCGGRDGREGMYIWFTSYNNDVEARQHRRDGIESKLLYNRIYAIESDNVNLFAYTIFANTQVAAQEMPEPIAIAAKVIEDSGNGPCKRIQ